MAHIGFTPQSELISAGTRVGAGSRRAAKLPGRGRPRLAEAGAFSHRSGDGAGSTWPISTAEVPIPTIGIGAGLRH